MHLNKIILLLVVIIINCKLYGNNSIPDSLNYVVIDSITIKGNEVTKESIIYRELTFSIGDSIQLFDLDSRIINSKENLLNTSLFNFVYITKDDSTSSNIKILIEVKERWYWWPFPIFGIEDRNPNVWLKDKDWSRANYGVDITKENFRGRNEKLKFLLQYGYSQRYTVSYDMPYINKKQTTGLGFAIEFINNHELAYKSEDNDNLYYKDEDNYLRKEFRVGIIYKYRKGIHKTHSLLTRYNDYWVGDTIARVLNPRYLGDSISSSKFFLMQYLFKLDYRDNKPYPLNGYYFDLELLKKGFGLFGERNVNNLTLTANARKYFKFYNRLYYASGLTIKLSDNNFQPFFNVRGIGYGNEIVRSYEFYVIDGQNLVLSKNNIKFEIIKPKVAKMKYLSIEEFNTFHYALYLNVFSDIGYVENKQSASMNSLSNELLVGYGIGLDYVTYYDKVLRIEYSVNKLGEKGFYLHLVAPI